MSRCSLTLLSRMMATTWRCGGAEDDEQDEPALHRLGVRSQPHHLAVGHQVADGQNLVRVLGQFGRDAADPARILAPARLRAQELIELLLQRDSFFERGKLLLIERQEQQLVGNLPKAAMYASVVGGQSRVFYPRQLLRQALDRALGAA